MIGILLYQRRPHGLTHGRLRPQILANLTAQDPDRIAPFTARTVIPTLQSRQAEADGFTADRMAPGACRQQF
jgi:hypothetical protein